MLNVITLFSGYDSQALALNRLGIPYDLVAWAEIDKHACTAHDALFPQFKGRNVGDVSKVDWAEWHKQHPQPIDLLTYSSPCQDFSSAGLQRGGEEGSGTRSGLLWETERAVRELRPRHLVFENVGGLVSDKFIDLFNRWQARLNKYGYTNFSQLMNAKDYGVPQNRLRIFMVSIIDCQQAYYFAKPFPLERRLKDVLEQNVDERYYLSDEQVQKLMAGLDKEIGNETCIINRPHGYFNGDINKEYSPAIAATEARVHKWVAEPQINVIGNLYDNNGQAERIYDANGISPTLDNIASGGNKSPKIVEPCISSIRGRADGEWHRSEHQQRLEIGGSDTSNSLTSVAKDNLLIEPRSKRQESIKAKVMPNGDIRCYQDIPGKPGVSEMQFTHPDNESPTVTCEAQVKVIEPGIRIRRLTERELYRLMDVSEPDIDTLLAAPIPRTQHAKLAGNSIVVACLYYIFRNLFVDTEPEAGTQTKLF